MENQDLIQEEVETVSIKEYQFSEFFGIVNENQGRITNQMFDSVLKNLFIYVPELETIQSNIRLKVMYRFIQVCNTIHTTTLQPGEKIINEFDEPTKFYVVAKGTLLQTGTGQDLNINVNQLRNNIERNKEVSKS